MMKALRMRVRPPELTVVMTNGMAGVIKPDLLVQ